MSLDTHNIDAAIRLVKAAIDCTFDLDDRVTVEMSGRVARLFLDFLYALDPDMPPLPVCKVLGPLVGDIVMNAKLNRLDALVDALGPLVVRLERLTEGKLE